MSEILYFILDSGEETRYLEVPEALRKPVQAYVTDHTKYTISAIIERFTERPVFVDTLEDFLTETVGAAVWNILEQAHIIREPNVKERP